MLIGKLTAAIDHFPRNYVLGVVAAGAGASFTGAGAAGAAAGVGAGAAAGAAAGHPPAPQLEHGLALHDEQLLSEQV